STGGDQMDELTRRGFAGIVAAAPLAAQQAAPNPNTSVQAEQQRRRGPPPRRPPFEGPVGVTRRGGGPEGEPFPMTQVRLLGGPFHEAQEWNRAYMARLSADRLLHNFRQNAGLPSKVDNPFGGWEAPADGKRGTELRGHFTGHFLSASAQ